MKTRNRAANVIEAHAGRRFNQESLKEYYGARLKRTSDLKTSACCCMGEQLSPAVRMALAEINDEILDRFYGCGSPLPPLLEGCAVLDLGCGSGRDAYLAARLAGSSGYVIGVDMTEEQLDVGRRNLRSQMARFGYKQSNVYFRQGYIEDLGAIGIVDNSVDAAISNCVINLYPDIALNCPEFEAVIGMVDFYSMTVRAFNLNNQEDLCEDYGRVAIYKGKIPELTHFFDLDNHHRFLTGKPTLVCANTAAMLQQTRYAAHFVIQGDRSVHFGPFNCSPAAAITRADVGSGGACC